jgi:NIMA (never in mitosis gene a)-related kinase 1/4/5
MITLRPPFRAENMEGLYNKVIKGQYSKIPDKFSNDLVELVKYLLQVQPENRPSPDQILKNPIIQKRLEFLSNKTVTEDMLHDNNLLQTIRIPKNLLFLTDRLPQANYDMPRKKMNSNTNNNISIKKKKYNSELTNSKKIEAIDIEKSDKSQLIEKNRRVETLDKLQLEQDEIDLSKKNSQVLSQQRQPSKITTKESAICTDKGRVLKDDILKRNNKITKQISYGSQDLLSNINRVGSIGSLQDRVM